MTEEKNILNLGGVQIDQDAVVNRLTKKDVKKAPKKLTIENVLWDKVIISEDVADVPDEVSEGGIIIPVAALKEADEVPRMARGVVVKAGVDCKFVKDGDVVIFDKMQCIITPIKGHEYLSIRETHILIIE